jgi:hypothetical protein
MDFVRQEAACGLLEARRQMGKLLFGKQEEIVCIADVSVRAKDKGELCLAYKTTTHFLGGGLYVTDDGYVLRVKQNSSEYYPLDSEGIRAHQAAGALPTPLPGYALPFSTYLLGYSLWIGIFVALLSGLLQRARVSRKKARLKQLRDVQPVSYGPPALLANVDRFVAMQTMPLLRPGEQVQHQAYGVDRDMSEGGVASLSAQGVFGVLTDQRLILIRTRLGALWVLLENRGVESIERSSIVNVREKGDLLTFDLVGGGERYIHVKLGARGVSNQLAFLRDVPRLLAPRASTAPQPASRPFGAPAAPT